MINYERLGNSVRFYREKGYQTVEVPWIIDQKAVDSTLPPNSKPMFVGSDQYLAGSAEQGFVQLILDDRLAVGKYQAITPCFRNDEVDAIHQKYFMKNELFVFPFRKGVRTDSYESDLNTILQTIMMDAHDFFALQSLQKIDVIKTEIGYDLCSENIELGSYGIRHENEFSWVYGTGLAEPRLSYVKQQQRIRWQKEDALKLEVL